MILQRLKLCICLIFSLFTYSFSSDLFASGSSSSSVSSEAESSSSGTEDDDSDEAWDWRDYDSKEVEAEMKRYDRDVLKTEQNFNVKTINPDFKSNTNKPVTTVTTTTITTTIAPSKNGDNVSAPPPKSTQDMMLEAMRANSARSRSAIAGKKEAKKERKEAELLVEQKGKEKDGRLENIKKINPSDSKFKNIENMLQQKQGQSQIQPPKEQTNSENIKKIDPSDSKYKIIENVLQQKQSQSNPNLPPVPPAMDMNDPRVNPNGPRHNNQPKAQINANDLPPPPIFNQHVHNDLASDLPPPPIFNQQANPNIPPVPPAMNMNDPRVNPNAPRHNNQPQVPGQQPRVLGQPPQMQANPNMHQPLPRHNHTKPTDAQALQASKVHLERDKKSPPNLFQKLYKNILNFIEGTNAQEKQQGIDNN